MCSVLQKQGWECFSPRARISRSIACALSVTAFLLFFLITSPVRAAINGVAAVVNGEMITAFDLQAETAPEAMRRGLNPKDPNQAAAIEELTKQRWNA